MTLEVEEPTARPTEPIVLLKVVILVSPLYIIICCGIDTQDQPNKYLLSNLQLTTYSLW